MKRAFIIGINGKMGKMLSAVATSFGYQIAGGIDLQRDKANNIFTTAKEVNVDFDVVIDFSRPSTLDEVCCLIKSKKTPLVSATTGYTADEDKKITELSKIVPVFRSANMSIGVAAQKAAAVVAKSILGDDFDIEIVEKHHNQKVDSPSGTAIMLADALTEKQNQIFSRNGKRNKGEVGIVSVRGGGVVGEHEIGFYGEDEIVTIAHSARSRKLFASGAYRAADFITSLPPGKYDMDDLVNSLIK